MPISRNFPQQFPEIGRNVQQQYTSLLVKTGIVALDPEPLLQAWRVLIRSLPGTY